MVVVLTQWGHKDSLSFIYEVLSPSFYFDPLILQNSLFNIAKTEKCGLVPETLCLWNMRATPSTKQIPQRSRIPVSSISFMRINCPVVSVEKGQHPRGCFSLAGKWDITEEKRASSALGRLKIVAYMLTCSQAFKYF